MSETWAGLVFHNDAGFHVAVEILMPLPAS